MFTYDTISKAFELITLLDNNLSCFISLVVAWLHAATHYDFLS